MQLLLEDVRRGARSDSQALEAHERITGLKMRLLGDRVSRRNAWQIARRNDWNTLHDAEYLSVAQLAADALVTVDRRLAARADALAVPVVPLERLLRQP